ncbi:MAG: hypothetical protein AMK73_09780 [Planctomycetes bacterium SM23_32]|nr:MAG: hypothetical protein AMK73_09780 [Planctomycetes bacterium SM23_32]
MSTAQPAENYRRIRGSLPPEVMLVLAAKGRSAEEVAQVIAAGATAVGHNYVQEAARMAEALGTTGKSVEWHMIGHLQRNKVKQALPLFDVIQSLDSVRLARAISARAERPVPVYVEVNVAGEESKFGVPPQRVRALVQEAARLPNVHIEGLMTMEPYSEDPEDARPCFRRVRALFEELRDLDAPGVDLRVLSMGMTGSYRVAVEEGATMVRIGTAVFGPLPA